LLWAVVRESATEADPVLLADISFGICKKELVLAPAIVTIGSWFSQTRQASDSSIASSGFGRNGCFCLGVDKMPSEM